MSCSMSSGLLLRVFSSTTVLHRPLLTRGSHYGRCVAAAACVSRASHPSSSLHSRPCCTSSLLPSREKKPAAADGYLNAVRHYSKKAKKKKSGGGASSDIYQDEKTKELVDLEYVQQEMQEVLQALKEDYLQQLSVRTSSGSLDNLMVSTKQGKTPLNQLGQITMKSAQLIHINMANATQEIDLVVKAIEKSGMNLNPRVNQSIIEVPMPKITKEHREMLAKLAKDLCQRCKDALKSIRNNHAKMVKKAKGAKGLSSDTIVQLEKQIQHLMEDSVKQADEIYKMKTSELLGS